MARDSRMEVARRAPNMSLGLNRRCRAILSYHAALYDAIVTNILPQKTPIRTFDVNLAN